MLIIGLHKNKKRQLERAVFPVNNGGGGYFPVGRGMLLDVVCERLSLARAAGVVSKVGKVSHCLQGRPESVIPAPRTRCRRRRTYLLRVRERLRRLLRDAP